MKKIVLFILCLLVLTGCTSAKDTVDKNSSKDTTSTDSLDDTFYPIVNLGANTNRETIYSDFHGTDDFQTIGRELQVLSTEHYSTSKYYMSEGLQFTKDDKDNLLLRSDDPKKYPYSLQPSKGTSIENIENPIMVENIYEQDYYTKGATDYKLEGLSVAIVVHTKDSSDHELSTPMSDSVVKEYARGTIEKLYKYMQSKKKLKDLPVFIAVYQAATSNNSYSGKYIYSSYCNGSVGSISELDYNTLVFTSSDAEKKDAETSSQFAIFKNNLKNAATEAVGVIGYGRYQDGHLKSMKIQMSVNIKTYTELIYLVQLAADDLDSRFSGFDISVIVNDQDGLKAVIIKKSGKSAESTLLY